ncbi:sugar kinase [Alteraurantiacibacter aestuarii]|uniref:sugar kinase n=1 Tax=Alteraurantiacibacter aestuarii TaxID=650004 RepID=UPI0031E1AC17
MAVTIVGEAMLEYHSSNARSGLCYGGDTLNTAIHLARLGHDVRYVTALGTDPVSDALVAAWRDEGIDTRFVLRHPERHPGIYAIHLDETGERSFLYWRDNSAARDMFALPGMDAALEEARASRLLYYSLITLAILPEQAREALFGLAQSVRQRGGDVAYDSNYRTNLWTSAAEARAISARAASGATIGLPTDGDECALAGEDLSEEEIARRWLDLGCRDVVVKAGAEGCLFARQGEAAVHFPAEKLAMVDASGAGDAFNAGYLSGWMNGGQTAAAIASGQALAGWVIRRSGAVPVRDDAAPYGAIA